MSIPDWRTHDGGTKTRVALWLCTTVGEGSIFTKSQLRAAFPGVEQVDRRMRDLRTDKWVIHTSRDDATLASDELRLVSRGEPVWDPAYRPERNRTLGAHDRRALFAADDFACRLCGMAGGEPYPEDPARTAQLTYVQIDGPDSSERVFLTVCGLCARARSDGLTDELTVAAEIDALGEKDRQDLVTWMRRGVRNRSAAERLWAAHMTLPAEARERVRQRVIGRR